jgi:hypothetical protein
MKKEKMQRKELKYYIGNDSYQLLRNRLKNIMKGDEFNPPGKPYFIRSLYFDTLSNRHFYEKMYGVENRMKIRLRIYSPKDKKVKFEIKNKSGNIIHKETAVITRKDALKLQECDFDCLLKYKNPILNKAYCILKSEVFKPVIVVEYMREAYTFGISNVRITFDTFVSSSKTNLNLFVQHNDKRGVLGDNLVIMEIKFDDCLPEFIRKAIQLPRAEKESISKYCLGRIAHG